jgi:sugar phosphate isomerase/epimerase
MLEDILRRVQVNMPFHLLYKKYLPLVVQHGINPEIGFNHVDLERFEIQDFVRVAEVIRDKGLTITLHAPFMDLRPGAVDPKIRQASIERLFQVFDLVPFFAPQCIVCHPSFDERYYISTEEAWLENSLDTWRKFLELAEEMGTAVSLENVYERTPDHLGRLFQALKGPNIFFCLDTGHFNAFSNRNLDGWLKVLGPRIGQIHLHDNAALADDHLPVGEGNFPFGDLFAYLEEQGLHPIITLEPHTEENLWKTVTNLEATGLLQGNPKHEARIPKHS